MEAIERLYKEKCEVRVERIPDYESGAVGRAEIGGSELRLILGYSGLGNACQPCTLRRLALSFLLSSSSAVSPFATNPIIEIWVILLL